MNIIDTWIFPLEIVDFCGRNQHLCAILKANKEVVI